MTIQSVAVRTISRFAPRNARTGGALSGLVYCYIALGRQTKLDSTFYSESGGILGFSGTIWEMQRFGIYSADWHSVEGPSCRRRSYVGKAAAGDAVPFFHFDVRLRKAREMTEKCWYC